jgi:hypothetical protein
MPLITGKSQKSFEKNLKTELHSGKPLNQSLAIAYAMKRKAQKKAHGGEIHIDINPHPEELKHEKYAHGGHVGHHSGKSSPVHAHSSHSKHHLAHGGKVSHYAKGGRVEPEEDMEHEWEQELSAHEAHESTEHEMEEEGIVKDDLIGRILKKHHYSKGGMVANQGSAIKSHLAGGKLNEFDDLALRDTLEWTQKDYGDHEGNEREDHDRADIVHRIMRSLRKKDKLPSLP